MGNLEKIKKLIPVWYAQKAWAEEILVRAFNLTKAEDILSSNLRGKKSIPGTNWMYRTHGIGVDIYLTAETGGIDFDFDKPDPDEWRLRIFFEKQYNQGNLPLSEYRELYEDLDLWETYITTALT